MGADIDRRAGMTVQRIPIQRRELDAALMDGTPDSVLHQAALAIAHVMDGHTVIIEERIGAIGDEVIIEETILELARPS